MNEKQETIKATPHLTIIQDSVLVIRLLGSDLFESNIFCIRFPRGLKGIGYFVLSVNQVFREEHLEYSCLLSTIEAAFCELTVSC